MYLLSTCEFEFKKIKFKVLQLAAVDEVAVNTCPLVGAVALLTFTVVVADREPFAVTLFVLSVNVLFVNDCVASVPTIVVDASGTVSVRVCPLVIPPIWNFIFFVPSASSLTNRILSFKLSVLIHFEVPLS